jgi:maleylpyruvate isomerase
MTIPDEIEALRHSDQRAVRSVDSLADAQWAESSLLPGWTRAHVVAHLALNAEAFSGALLGLMDGEPVPLYPSEAVRDADIDALATAVISEIRSRFFAGSQHFRNIAADVTAEQWGATVARLPQGPHWPASTLIATRRREVEIHHADLGVAYTHRSWPTDFCAELLDRVTADHSASGASPGFSVRATDKNRTWSAGAPEPVVEGFAADLGWWLVGRGHGEGLSCESGLPDLGPWRRAPVQGR